MLFKNKQLLIAGLTLCSIYSCQNSSNPSESDIIEPISNISIISYSLPNYYSHDTTLFTEGFLFHNGQLFESTGSPDDLSQTKSLIGITDLKTGKFEEKIELDKTKYFGEGIVFLGSKLFQLTYKNQEGFIYDATTFKKIG